MTRCLYCFIFSVLSFSTFAQDTLQRKATHYIGIQANQLLKQIFNFSTNNTVIDNPYLLTWTVNSKRTGWGLNTGLGYTVSNIKDGDALLSRESDISSLSFRIGFDKKSTFGKRWLLSRGIDVLIDHQKNKTTNTSNTDFNKSRIETDNTVSGWGFGPRVGLSYHITDAILLGTEANYYFRSTKTTGTVTSTQTFQQFDPNTGQIGTITNTTKTETDNKGKRFQLNVPAVLFLILKF